MRLEWRVDHMGRQRIGTQRLGWEDCVKRGLAGVGGEWRMRARDRGEWRQRRNGISDGEEGKTKLDDRYRCQPHPGLPG